MKAIHSFIILFIFAGVTCCLLIGYKALQKCETVLTPVRVSLDSTKYKILKEDSLIIEGMNVKRIYYLQKNKR